MTRVNYKNNDSCCFNDGDSNLCNIDYKKGGLRCMSHLSDYCVDSGMNDKCVSYCKHIDNNCNNINYEYCKQNVEEPLCKDLCLYSLDNKFVEDVCHKTEQYLKLISIQVKTDIERENQLKKERAARELNALKKIIEDRRNMHTFHDENSKKIKNQLLADAAKRSATRSAERKSAKIFTEKLEEKINEYKNYLLTSIRKAKQASDALDNARLRQEQIKKAQLLQLHNKISSDLNKKENENIQYSINKIKVMDLLSKTYNIEAQEISNKTGIPIDEIHDISAELIYNDKLILAENPDIVNERNKTLIPQAKKEAEAVAQEVRDNPLSYAEVIDAIKIAKEKARKEILTYQTIDMLNTQAQEAAEEEINKMIKNGITDLKLINEGAIEAENNALKAGLTEYDITIINNKAKKLSKEYEKKERKKLEEELNLKFPEDPKFPDRDLQNDLNILVPFILENMDMSLENISKETKVPLHRIYDLEFNINKRIDDVINNEISKSLEGFENIKLTTEEKIFIHKQFKEKLLKKFNTQIESDLWFTSHIFLFIIILIFIIIFGKGICKTTFNKKYNNKEYNKE